jgi:2Fe-2S ferredoxin
MPTVIFVEHDGTRHTLDVAIGESLMNAGLAGIDAECGGAAMCATCHVYVAEPFAEKIPEINVLEEEMLQSTACERKRCSRLSCQLGMTEKLEGLVLNLPESQT